MATYADWPIETDSTTLAEDAFAWLADTWPGWVPSPANWDAALIEANALMAAEVRDLAANVPDAIFRRMGEFAGLPPLEATYATLTATVTAVDALGYTLPADTAFALRATGDLVYLFASDDEVTIPVGSTTSPEFTLTAQETGSGPNGLAGALTVADRAVIWFDSAETTGPADGGTDAETNQAYLDRLTTELRLSAPRPILPADFAEFAKRFPQVLRAVAIDLYVPYRATITRHTNGGTAGTYTVTVNDGTGAQTTAALPFNAPLTVEREAINALSNVDYGDLRITGGYPGNTDIEHPNWTVTINTAGITAGTMTTTTPQTYIAPQTNVARAVMVYITGIDGLDPGDDIRAMVDADLSARREVNFIVNVRAPSYDTINVVFTADAYPGWDPDDVEQRAIEAVQNFLSPATHGAPPFGESRAWYPDTLIRLGELVEALNRVDGLWRLTGPAANGMPTINGSAANYTLTGAEAVILPLPGLITGTVVLP